MTNLFTLIKKLKKFVHFVSRMSDSSSVPEITAQCGQPKSIPMKKKYSWLSALAIAATVSSQLESMAATNGPIVITTRKGQDLTWGTGDSNLKSGPGQTSPGDVAMGALLGDHGYVTRYIIDAELNPTQVNPLTTLAGDQNFYLFPSDPLFEASLVINSGTSGSADIGAPNTSGIPIIMGEHSCISDVIRPSKNSLYMYSGTGSDDVKNDEPGQGGSNQFMKVLLPNHPIMQGIPLLPDGTVKIFRDPYSEEGGAAGFAGPLGAHTPAGGKRNYEYAWTAINASQAAPGTQVIGTLPAPFDGRAVFATADIGAQLANYTTGDPGHQWSIAFGDNKAHQRLVHWMVNDQGSGGSRRCFNSLTEVGRLIFIRTVKWALGEPLAPVQTFKVLDVTPVGKGVIQIRWEGSASKRYQLVANDDLNTSNWRTVVEDIPGVDGIVNRHFDVSAAPDTLFMRIQATP